MMSGWGEDKYYCNIVALWHLIPPYGHVVSISQVHELMPRMWSDHQCIKVENVLWEMRDMCRKLFIPARKYFFVGFLIAVTDLFLWFSSDKWWQGSRKKIAWLTSRSAELKQRFSQEDCINQDDIDYRQILIWILKTSRHILQLTLIIDELRERKWQIVYLCVVSVTKTILILI